MRGMEGGEKERGNERKEWEDRGGRKRGREGKRKTERESERGGVCWVVLSEHYSHSVVGLQDDSGLVM